MGKREDGEKKVESVRKLARTAILNGVKHVNDIVAGTAAEANDKWNDRTIRTQVSVMMAGHQQQNERVKQQVNAPRAFGVVFMPAQAASVEAWEREAKCIDVEPQPVAALPSKDPK